ncbi:MAG: hypothetical protein K0S70_2353 [Microbacterium sp.]|jgi:hypothetical protein|nr:hypothetical protein [Microbacterium sp.]
MNVPEIWFKTQRVLRTAIAVVVSGLSTISAGILALALVAPDVLAELAKILPASWIAWATGALASLVAIASVVTRIMAIPKVNGWLTKIGLGSVPKSKVVATEGAGDDAVLPDPSVVTRDEYQAAIESRRALG